MTGRDPAPWRREGRAWWVALAVVLLAAAAASPWLADRWGSWTTSLQDRAATAPGARLEAQRALEGSASLLVVVADDDGAARSVALLTRPEAGDGLVVLVPTDLFELLPGYGEFTLGEASAFEGPGLVATVVSNALGVRIDDVVFLRSGALAAALPGPVEVDLPAPLVVASGTGPDQLIADAGPAIYEAALVESLLVSRGSNDGLEWLERQAAVWGAVLEAASIDAAVAERLASPAAVPETAVGVIASVAASSPQVTLMPVDRAVGAGETDGFTVDVATAEAFVASRLPHLALADGERARVEVLNGNGRVLATRPVADVLISAGFRVVRTDNAERFDIPETLVIAQGRENRPAAERALAALAVGSLQLELSSPSGVVDVSIIVGLDVPAGEG